MGKIVVYLVGVVVVVEGLADEGQPTNTGMFDSEVDFIILLGRGVMYDLERILMSWLVNMQTYRQTDIMYRVLENVAFSLLKIY